MTFTAPNPREAYLAASVATAGPGQLLVMLCERLVLDVQRATDALRRDEPAHAHDPLLHAQDIVLELAASLRVDAWDGGPGLAALYVHLHRELVGANVRKSLTTAEHCLQLATDLRDTWRQAALQQMSESA